MRVEFSTYEDFLDEVETVGQTRDSLVRVRVDRIPEQEQAVTFQIQIWVTAVFLGSEPYLGECGFIVGSSDHGADDEAEMIVETIKATCASRNISVRHGKIELF